MGKKVVLLYHRVNNTESDYNKITIEEENFYAHMSYLKANYKVITLEEMTTYNGSEDIVAITFDDGFADFHGKALPILTELQIPVTVFITTGKLNTSEELWTTEILKILFANRADEKEIRLRICGKNFMIPVFTIEQRGEAYVILRNILRQASCEERNLIMRSLRKQLEVDERGREEYRLMSFLECREVAQNQLVTIGAHTVNHCSLGRVSKKEMCYEIRESIRNLETILKQKIKYFAYPFGEPADYSDRVIDVLHQSGIEAACIVKAENYDSDKDSIYKIPRYSVGNWALNQFQDKLSEWISGQEVPMRCDKPQTYIGKMEHDTELWLSNRKVVIWGSGIRGKKVYELFCRYGQIDRVAAFVDNNPKLWGQNIDDIPIWSIEQIKLQENIEIIIYNTHDMEIIRQLEYMGLEKIHWWIL